MAYRYHIALSPLDGTLFISDPESHLILKVRDVNDFSDPDHNWEPFVGSGERCLPGDEAHCGDGALARDAKLAYPKGRAEWRCIVTEFRLITRISLQRVLILRRSGNFS